MLRKRQSRLTFLKNVKRSSTKAGCTGSLNVKLKEILKEKKNFKAMMVNLGAKNIFEVIKTV